MDELADDDTKVQQIRKAATTLFLQHGFGHVSTAALAKEAGVSKETLYSRYPNKDAVLADVLQHLISAGRPGPGPMPVLRTRADLKTALLHFTRTLGSQLMQREYLELSRVVIAETPRLPHIGEIFRRSVPEVSLRHAGALLESARTAGLIGDVDLAAAARMLVGPVVIQVLLNGLLVAPSADRSQTPGLDTDTHVHLLLAMLSPARKAER
ncbi:MAG: TetR/AcrR family transcriptional regulator [Mycobacterium sp.]|nr:TetR/AcrR family transcriptional regulator [Mycobacterium sp.]